MIKVTIANKVEYKGIIIDTAEYLWSHYVFTICNIKQEMLTNSNYLIKITIKANDNSANQ